MITSPMDTGSGTTRDALNVTVQRADHTDVAHARRLDIEQAHIKVRGIFGGLPSDLQPKHAQKLFEHIEKKEGTAQQMKGTFIACTIPISSTGSFNFHSHIIACPIMPRVS